MSQASPPTSPSAEPAPLLCPLCDYNLTGLEHPQCPECGHAFEWDELTNPARRRHKWFFEHGPFLSSFFKTHLALFRPKRFWTTLRPSYFLSTQRAFLFYLLSTFLFLAPALGVTFASYAATTYQAYLSARRAQLVPLSNYPTYTQFLPPGTKLPPNPTLADYNAFVMRFPSASVYLDQLYPLLDKPAFWSITARSFFLGRQIGYTNTLIASSLLLPAISALLILSVMRQSFSRVRMNYRHAWRVALYSSNLFPFLPILILVFLIQTVLQFTPFGPPHLVGTIVSSLTFLLIPLYHARSIHLATAHYLGIRHSRSVAAATCVTLLLLCAILYFQVTHYALH